MKRYHLFFFAIMPLGMVFLSVIAGVRLKKGGSDSGKMPLSEELEAAFRYEKLEQSGVSLKELQSNSDYAVFRADVRSSAIDTGGEKSVELDCYLPTAAYRLPVVIILPISGGGYSVEKYFAEYFVERRVAAIIVRRDGGKLGDDLGGVDGFTKQSVIDCRRALDWVECCSEFDIGKIGLVGTSLGGMKGFILAAVDKRIRAYVIGLAGGDLAHILSYSDEPGISRRRSVFMRKRGISNAEELKATLRREIKFDPMRFTPFVDPDDALLVLAWFDKTVPFETGWNLRRKMGYPETIILPTDHYFAVAYIVFPRVQSAALDFFRSRFAEEDETLVADAKDG